MQGGTAAPRPSEVGSGLAGYRAAGLGANDRAKDGIAENAATSAVGVDCDLDGLRNAPETSAARRGELERKDLLAQ